MLDRRVDPSETSGIMEGRFHPPGNIRLGSVSTIGAVATATQAARTDGGKYVVDSFKFTVGAAVQLSSGIVTCNVIDGDTGGTTYLWQETIGIGTTGAVCISPSPLALVGSANTKLTIEFSGAIVNGYESVNLAFHCLGGSGV